MLFYVLFVDSKLWTPRARSQTIEKILCFHSCSAESVEKKNIVFSLLFEIVAAVDKEPGEPGEVIDGGTKKSVAQQNHRKHILFPKLFCRTY